MSAWVSSIQDAGSQVKWKENLPELVGELSSWSEMIRPLAQKVAQGQRLSLDDGLLLYSHPNLSEVGRLSNCVRVARFGSYAFFNSNVHVNQTNVCVLACKFCAFRRSKRADDAYALDIEAYLDDLGQYAEVVDEVHSVGGLHPDWDVEYYESLFKATKNRFPHIAIKALTAVEIKHLSQLSNISFKETLLRLKNAGLGSLPGGGAEILDDDVRAVICNGKESSSEYLEIHRSAHELGIPTNCTMLFGTIETLEQRLTHMIHLRELNDDTNGFQCFVPYPYLPDNSRLPEAQLATGSEILRTIAISRLMLDTIPHIKAYRMNIGDELAELALQYGADDIDGTVQKESIMHLAGSTTPLDHDRIRLARLISDAGCIPVQRNTTYEKFEIFIPPVPKPRTQLKMANV
ncbi:MAG: CofH family radical SAM protein [Candidatus Poseidoniales archaeon]|jgi:aminodeoxyfutalosine synthase|tara:strand:- start:529 stop:1743 length:1215 start_codon:yes stop_codon:yes gene_type:complete